MTLKTTQRTPNKIDNSSADFIFHLERSGFNLKKHKKEYWGAAIFNHALFLI